MWFTDGNHSMWGASSIAQCVQTIDSVAIVQVFSSLIQFIGIHLHYVLNNVDMMRNKQCFTRREQVFQRHLVFDIYFLSSHPLV